MDPNEELEEGEVASEALDPEVQDLKAMKQKKKSKKAKSRQVGDKVASPPDSWTTAPDSVEKIEKKVKLDNKPYQRKNKNEFISSTYKTPPCEFYRKGSCQKGADCTYSHDIQVGRPDVVCRFYLTGNCTKGNNCVFSHDLKKYPCKFFWGTGHCAQDAQCRFSHEPIRDEQRIMEFIEQNEEYLMNVFDKHGTTNLGNYFLNYRQKKLAEQNKDPKAQHMLLPPTPESVPYHPPPQNQYPNQPQPMANPPPYSHPQQGFDPNVQPNMPPSMHSMQYPNQNNPQFPGKMGYYDQKPRFMPLPPNQNFQNKPMPMHGHPAGMPVHIPPQLGHPSYPYSGAPGQAPPMQNTPFGAQNPYGNPPLNQMNQNAGPMFQQQNVMPQIPHPHHAHGQSLHPQQQQPQAQPQHQLQHHQHQHQHQHQLHLQPHPQIQSQPQAQPQPQPQPQPPQQHQLQLSQPQPQSLPQPQPQPQQQPQSQPQTQLPPQHQQYQQPHVPQQQMQPQQQMPLQMQHQHQYNPHQQQQQQSQAHLGQQMLPAPQFRPNPFQSNPQMMSNPYMKNPLENINPLQNQQMPAISNDPRKRMNAMQSVSKANVNIGPPVNQFEGVPKEIPPPENATNNPFLSSRGASQGINPNPLFPQPSTSTPMPMPMIEKRTEDINIRKEPDETDLYRFFGDFRNPRGGPRLDEKPAPPSIVSQSVPKDSKESFEPGEISHKGEIKSGKDEKSHPKLRALRTGAREANDFSRITRKATPEQSTKGVNLRTKAGALTPTRNRIPSGQFSVEKNPKRGAKEKEYFNQDVLLQKLGISKKKELNRVEAPGDIDKLFASFEFYGERVTTPMKSSKEQLSSSVNETLKSLKEVLTCE